MSERGGWHRFDALEARRAGLSVIPIREDGSKAPDLLEWKPYSEAPPAMREVSDWFANRRTGLALVCGRASEGLEMLEFEGRAVDEGVLDDFLTLVKKAELSEVWERITEGYVEESPSGGLHYYFRVPEPAGSQVLARRPSTEEELAEKPKQKSQVLIETRGQGGYVVVAPSSGGVHETGKSWRRLRGSFLDIVDVNAEERDAIYDVARSLDRVKPRAVRNGPSRGRGREGGRPGDAYNGSEGVQERTLQLLESDGWEVVAEAESGYHLRRPGKDVGISATLGYCGSGVLYVFSTSTQFEPREAYSPFAVLAELEHGGDFSAAAAALLEKGYGDPVTAGKTGQGRRSQSTRLVELATESYALGCSDAGQAFVVPGNGAQVPLLLESVRSSLKSELSSHFYANFGSVPTTSALNDALNTIEGMARAKPDRKMLHRRVANRDGEIWIDPGDVTGHAIRVAPEGWSLAEPPVLFVRSKASRTLPVPEPGGNVDDLRRFLNVSTHLWPLLVAWLVAAFIPDIPHPILSINGEHGTGKSTLSRRVVRLIDPSVAEVRALPTKLDDWAVAANGSYVVALDNVSSLSQAMSDALCRAATGDSLVTRKLYTDHEEAILTFRRVIILNGIGLNRIAGDLADRTLSIELEPITGSARLTEEELLKDFERELPRLFGALLDLVAATLKALPKIDQPELPRMADFARIVSAVDAVRGTSALEVYVAQASELSTAVIEGDQVGAVLQRFLAERHSWSGTSTELLEDVDSWDPDVKDWRFWPRTPEAMGMAVTRLAPDLRKLGYTADFERGSKRRTWTLALPPPKERKKRRVVRRRSQQQSPSSA